MSFLQSFEHMGFPRIYASELPAFYLNAASRSLLYLVQFDCSLITKQTLFTVSPVFEHTPLKAALIIRKLSFYDIT